VLRLVILPFGRVRKSPSDNLDHKVAALLHEPSETRSRIGSNQYLLPKENNPAGKLELALETILQAEPVFNKICKSIGQKSRSCN
jgi:acyl-CoA dehydrogenase